MPRPSQANERRKRLLPIVAKAFAELGYRRTTTAKLAKRCKVRENILYRLWRDKKAMFVASIEYVYALSAETWGRLLAEADDAKPPAERLLKYEAE
ncbi:MAG: TetR/AcrR family transcriptional regulator, partial [Planctomycetota bacterium]